MAVVQTREPPELLISARDSEQLAKWEDRAEAIGRQQSLFEDPGKPRPPFEVIPWRFRYRYKCLEIDCGGHAQTIVDWEAFALWRNVRWAPDWRSQIRRKFEDELWAEDRDTVLFVGNMEQYPRSFLVLGVFWPPLRALQPSLFG